MNLSLKDIEKTLGFCIHYKVNKYTPEIIQAYFDRNDSTVTSVDTASHEAYPLFQEKHAEIAASLKRQFSSVKKDWLTVIRHFKEYLEFSREIKKLIAKHISLSNISFESFVENHLSLPRLPDTYDLPVFLQKGDRVYELNLEMLARGGQIIVNAHTVEDAAIDLVASAEAPNHYQGALKVAYKTDRGLMFTGLKFTPHCEGGQDGEILNYSTPRLFTSVEALQRAWKQTLKEAVVFVNDSNKSKHHKFNLDDWLNSESPVDVLSRTEHHQYNWMAAQEDAKSQMEEWDHRPD